MNSVYLYTDSLNQSVDPALATFTPPGLLGNECGSVGRVVVLELEGGRFSSSFLLWHVPLQVT